MPYFIGILLVDVVLEGNSTELGKVLRGDLNQI